MEHRPSGEALLFPKSALVFRILCLREQCAAPSQNISTFNRGGGWVNITPTDISKNLIDAVRFLGPSLGFAPKYLYAHYLRAARAMAFLFYGVKTYIIKLVGQWRSDEML